MTKKISAVTGEYTDAQGQSKAEWTSVGVVIIGKNGKEYTLLDPSVSLAGVLVKQNTLAAKKGEAPSDMVMCSVFEQESAQAPQQGGYNQAPAQQTPQQGGYQGGYNPHQPQPAPQRR